MGVSTAPAADKARDGGKGATPKGGSGGADAGARKREWRPVARPRSVFDRDLPARHVYEAGRGDGEDERPDEEGRVMPEATLRRRRAQAEIDGMARIASVRSVPGPTAARKRATAEERQAAEARMRVRAAWVTAGPACLAVTLCFLLCRNDMRS